MRRDSRIRKSESNSISDKIIIYTLVGVTVLAIITFALLMYSKNINENVKNSTMSLEQMSDINSDEEDTQITGTEIGKSIEEAEKEIEEEPIVIAQENKTTTDDTKKTENEVKKEETKNNTTNNSESQSAKQEKQQKELSFQKPVEGDIVREYAKDNLVYSETLKEWVTHLGIDIKAEKTTVVKAAEAGTVKSIKNDPRYGLTVVIEHENNFQTVYANLLTSEFVVEGEKIEKGQSIGTIGNTAAFEIADEPHLHFEILKDSLAVDPSIYIK